MSGPTSDPSFGPRAQEADARADAERFDEARSAEASPSSVEATEPAPRVSKEARTLLASHCALAGLCPLIPLPVVDDMVETRVHRRLHRKICRLQGITLPPRSAKILSTRESHFFRGAAKSMVLWPAKKLLRKLTVVLAVKSAADAAAALFHEGWLFARAIEAGYVDRGTLEAGDEAAARALRRAIVRAHAAIDPSVTQSAMRSAFGVSRAILFGVVDAMTEILSSSGDEEERFEAAEARATPLTERIEAALREQWSKGPELDAALRRALFHGEA